jgi:uncharacterized protein (DUF2141 family)
MKTVSAIAAALIALSPLPALAAEVTVDISGIVKGKGDLYVALQSREEFLKTGHLGTIVRAPESGAQKVVVKDVPAGDWSVSVWHDTDGDRKFSRDANGVPTDGWSMVGAAAMRAAPKWEEVKLTVPATGTAVRLDMVYPR